MKSRHHKLLKIRYINKSLYWVFLRYTCSRTNRINAPIKTYVMNAVKNSPNVTGSIPLPPGQQIPPLPPAAAPTTALPQPIVSLKPTDFTIPHSLDELFPEIEQLRKLQDAEKRVDAYTTRKWMDLQDSIQAPSKTTSVLRIFIYNTAENQVWQKELSKSQGKEVNEQEEPTWTLRIEGRLLNDDEPVESENREKFSSYLTGIAIDLDPTAKFDSVSPNQQNQKIIEWHDNPQGNISAFDGMDIKRKGSEKVKCKITIQPKEYPTKFKLDDPLVQLLGSNEMSERDVIYALWQYIQINKLQDKADKRLINCDEGLEKIFGFKKIAFPDLLVLIRKFLRPVEPVTIDYEITPDKSSTLGDVVLDISVERRDVIEKRKANELNKLNEVYFKNDGAIKELDNKIALDIQALNQSRTKYEFYKRLANDPVDFLEKWSESHAKALKILTGDEGYTEENARRSEFYTDELLDENIDLLLNSNRI